MSARVPQTPDWKVVPGHATAIPAVPTSQAGLWKKETGAVSRQMVLKARGPSACWRSDPSMRPRKKRSMPPRGTRSADKFDDDDYPAYTMGRAAEMLDTTPAFLRALGEHRLITPLRSEGGHRRYSRYQLRIAGRVRELVDSGTPIEAACRIIILEDQLEEAQRINEELRSQQSA
ncbi:DNA-binding transcriptional regulator, MerR family [Actinacidiphila alni]|uniref:DNA-binding transcriptional regulator, MerR family n=2 Tax=Actinacidiphila alni TaxID=380248 RepID=A0A1I2MKU5_9ACTN|nr:DNA-binding transcriptional regulator, MerR family [Actinacidiphila alni]